MSLAPIHQSHKLLLCCVLALLLLSLVAAQGSGVFVDALRQESAPPMVEAPSARLTAGAPVRSGPGDRYLLLVVAEASADYPILGRSSNGLWLRIDYRGLPAWVAAAQTDMQPAGVPVVQVGGERL